MIQGDLRDIVNGLAERVGHPLLLEDERQRVVAYSPQYDRIDELRREAILTGSLRRDIMEWCDSFGIRTSRVPVRTPANPDLGALPRVCIPVRYAGILVGFIWVIDEAHEIDGEPLAVIVEAASSIAFLLYRDRLAKQLGSELLRGLVSSSSRLRASSADDPAVREVLPGGSRAVILVMRSGPDPAEVEAALRRQMVRTMHFVSSEEVVVLVPVAGQRPGATQSVIDAILATDRAQSAAVGVSDASPSPASLHIAYREAADAAWIVGAFPGLGRCGEWSKLGAYRVLARAAADGEASTMIDPRLGPVLDEPELAATLETYLDLGCRPKETAEALHVHRGTIYYRLAKIERMTGADLQSGSDRLSFHVGVKMRRFREVPTSPGPGVDDQGDGLDPAGDEQLVTAPGRARGSS